MFEKFDSSEPIPTNPFKLFTQWFTQARHVGEKDPTIMMLATATPQGVPSIRTVLLKAFDEQGFVFYTNLQSRKAQELQTNTHVALCFYWPILDKQVRIEGQVQPVSDAEADQYFASRPRGSQLGAWASSQSQVLSHPDELLKKYHKIEQRFAGQTVTRPPFWSGFRVIPNYLEFWQQGQYRLHTRICYRKTTNAEWQINYLYP
ncbi:MAG: pyridoxamine 5'-phosphate oxidase [Gammaproteobacteria bacterium]